MKVRKGFAKKKEHQVKREGRCMFPAESEPEICLSEAGAQTAELPEQWHKTSKSQYINFF